MDDLPHKFCWFTSGGGNGRFVDDGGEGFLEDLLQNDGAIPVKSIIFIAFYALVDYDNPLITHMMQLW